MTKEEFIQRYNLNESHSEWQDIDSWMAIELFRFMHDRLPSEEDTTLQYVLDFLDKLKTDIKFKKKAMLHQRFGSFFLTSKRLLYRYMDDVLAFINEKSQKENL